MSSTNNATKTFLDDGQYREKNILRYERIFGDNFVSTGGLTTTQELCHMMPLRPGVRVLDIGSGSGGSALYMSAQYGCHVTGVDLSANMTSLARRRQRQLPDEKADKVEFLEEDITKQPPERFSPGQFDIVYSRDTLLHVADKLQLFSNVRRWLSPSATATEMDISNSKQSARTGHQQQDEDREAGFLVITDYCNGVNCDTSNYRAYVQQRGYQLESVGAYASLLKQAGFQNVIAVDRSSYFLEILRKELADFQAQRAAFIQDFEESDYKDIVDGWQEKIERVEQRSQTWGLFLATTDN